MEVEKQFCTFYVDDLFMGVEVSKVQEVLRYQEMTSVPLSSPTVSGLINLRGQIVTAIDLRKRLELNARPEGQLPMNVVVRTNEGVVSMLVDSIGDVLEVPDHSFETPPETIDGITRHLVLGVYKLADNLLLILDTEKAVNLDSVPDEVKVKHA